LPRAGHLSFSPGDDYGRPRRKGSSIAFALRLKDSADVSKNTKNAQAIAKAWRGAVHALDPDRFQIEAMLLFRPSGAGSFPTLYPRLAPWALFLRRSAARPRAAFRGCGTGASSSLRSEHSASVARLSSPASISPTVPTWAASYLETHTFLRSTVYGLGLCPAT
jgi:hypothetical protein